MKKRPRPFAIRRRRLLQGLGASLLATPFVPWLEQAEAQDGPPKRFVVMWQPNGTPREFYMPTGNETSFQLGRIFSSYEEAHGPSVTGEDHRSVKENMVLYTGQRFIVQGGEDPHAPAATCALTGRPMMNNDWRGAGVSMDQRLADVLSEGAPVGSRRSLHLSPATAGQGKMRTISFRGANQPVPIQNDPAEVFSQLFAGTAPAEPGVTPSRRNQHVLDTIRAQACDLRGQLGAGDRERLDRHLTAIEELEAELQVPPPAMGSTCGAPDLESGVPGERRVCAGAWNASCECDESHGAHQCHRYERRAEQMARIAHLSLACDRSRVIAWSFGEAGQHFRWPWVHGVNTSNHGLGHRGDTGTDPGARNRLAENELLVQQWHADFVARFVRLLKETPEGDTSLLDNTMVLWQNELGVHYAGHVRDNPLVAVFGGAAMGVRGGRWVQAPGKSQNDIHLSILQQFGLPDTTFGQADWNHGPAGGLS